MRKKIIIAGIIILLVVFFYRIILLGVKFFPVFWQLGMNHTINLKSTNRRINVLLLGIGGGTHDGPDLTDTIIFASIDQDKNNITFVSIPRDLWIPSLASKINAAYADGEAKKHGDGLIVAKSIVSQVIGQNIDYGVRIDFSGFVKAVDSVGGLDVLAPNTFDDYNYPITGEEDNTCGHSDTEIASLSAQIATGSASEFDAFSCRYKHIHFDKGLRHMDGETALEFVRSRHALGSEGSDFARSRRQQAVIQALRNKVLSIQTFFDPSRVIGLVNILSDSIDTDIKQDEYDDFIRLAEKMKQAKMNNFVIDAGDAQTQRQGLLINPQVSEQTRYQWILIPRVGDGDFSEIHSYVACVLSYQACPILPRNKIPPI